MTGFYTNGSLGRRDVGRILTSASVATMLSGPTALALPRDPPATELLRHVNPELRAIAARDYLVTQRAPPLSETTLPSLRANSVASARPFLRDVSVSKHILPVPGGTYVAVYVVNAKAGQARPAILHTHGGGFVAGTAKAEVPRLQAIARELDCTIVSVEYRLAPETRWSGSLEDNYTGLKWLHDNASALGVDRTRLAVMGESAGGGHAALLAITARDRGEVPLIFQCLVYPMLDDRTGSAVAPPASIGWLGWTPQHNRYGWGAFLGQSPGGPDVPPAVPARVASVARLPAAWIGVGSIDLFVEEDITFATRLLEAGVMTELVLIPGAPHGFDTVGERFGLDVPIVNQFNRSKIAALRRAFAGS